MTMTAETKAEAIRIRYDELAASGDPDHYLDRVCDLFVFLDQHPGKSCIVMSRYDRQSIN